MKDKKKFWKGAAQISTEMITNLSIFTGVLAGLIFMVRPAMRKHKKLDLKIFDYVRMQTNKNNTQIMSSFTFFGTHNFFIPANIFLIFYFICVKRKWISIRIASIAISSLVLMFVLKAIFKRKRPPYPLEAAKGLSFPSGHAIMSVTFYGLMIYIITKSVAGKPLKISLIVLLIIFIQLIGFSRVYLRVHYASDVATGYIAGLLWLLISLNAIKTIEDDSKLNTRIIYKTAW